MTYRPQASHFVNGQYVDDEDGEAFDVIYPHTGETIATLHFATPAIIDSALESAKRAQKEWAKLSGTERGRVLRRAADLLRARNRELSEIETHDTGKPLSETLIADAASGADALEYFGGLAGTLTGEHIPRRRWRFCLYATRTAGGLCRHRRMELPDPNCRLEGGASPRLR